MYYTDYLEHYGILGMKWGVRRTPEQLGHRIMTNKTSVFGKLMSKTTGPMMGKAASMQEKLTGVSKQRVQDIKNDKTLTEGQKLAKRLSNIPGQELSEIKALGNADVMIKRAISAGKNPADLIPDATVRFYNTGIFNDIIREMGKRNGLDYDNEEDRIRLLYAAMFP